MTIVHWNRRKTWSVGLLRRFVATILGTGLLAGAGTLVVGVYWPAVVTSEFLAWVALVLGCELLVVGAVIERAHGRRDVERITAASWITLARAVALALLVGVLVAGSPSRTVGWVSSAFFAVAVLLDGVDGLVARLTGTVTALGSRLDAEIDGLTTLVGAAAAVGTGAASLPFLAVGVARYAFVGSLWWRRRRGRSVRELSSSRLRTGLSALLLVTIWLALLPTTDDARTTLLTTAMAIPFLCHFGWDWLRATMRVGPPRGGGDGDSVRDTQTPK